MKEDFLHYIWQNKKFDVLNLATSKGEPVAIHHVGYVNTNAGPDFFNAQITISNQKWAGNVEIHVKSSDWYLHGHETDSNYDNVILHVVWEHDVDVFRKDNSEIPVIQLKDYINESIINNYRKLDRSKFKWINCESEFVNTDNFMLSNWFERLYIERLHDKTEFIERLLEKSSNNWEAVLFWMLSKNFGLKVNGDAFFNLSQSFDFSVLRKLQSKPLQVEALLFGQAGLLEDDVQESYYKTLKSDYLYLKKKFNLEYSLFCKPVFLRLRPNNFPTIRLSQLASLYSSEFSLFSKLKTIDKLDDFYELLTVNTSQFWETHYTFSKTSKAVKKQTTKRFVNLLLINTIVPLQFAYSKQRGKSLDDYVLRILSEIKSEKNSVVDKFFDLKPLEDNALTSQALLQLKNKYCDKNQCLHCAVGNMIIAS